MLSDALIRVKKTNYKEECMWEIRNRVLEKEEDTSRKLHIFNIEKMKKMKWKSLEQIKATNQKESRKLLAAEKGTDQLRELESGDGYVSPFIPRSPKQEKPKKAPAKKKVVVKEWSDYAYERYQDMLEELDVTLRQKNEPEPEPIVEEVYHMPIPRIMIQQNTESESEPDEVLVQVTKEKEKKKRSLSKNIDFGRIKYLRNLRIIKTRK